MITKQLIDIRPATNSRSPCPTKCRGWYVLYHDGIAHYVRRAGDLDGAIRAAACILADGRVVDQVGSLNDEDREDVIGPSEIRQRCAALPTFAYPAPGSRSANLLDSAWTLSTQR
jgi:hypothetical protein